MMILDMGEYIFFLFLFCVYLIVCVLNICGDLLFFLDFSVKVEFCCFDLLVKYNCIGLIEILVYSWVLKRKVIKFSDNVLIDSFILFFNIYIFL